MNFLVNIGYWLLLGFCKFIGIMPFWFLYYVLRYLIYVGMYKVFSYRLTVVRENLRNSFPDKDKAELKSIERAFYLHLSEIFVDTIAISVIWEQHLGKRIIFENVEEHEANMKGKNWIAMLSHYGSWEYFSAYQHYTETQLSPVYRPIHNRVFDKYYKYIRSRFKVNPVPMNGAYRYIIESRNRPNYNFMLGLISDQNPSAGGNRVWHDFLNQKTLFFNGAEKMGVKFNLPIYYADIRKVSRARYVINLKPIYDGEEKVAEGEITERYVRALEQTILAEPRYWMWSHKRWKHRYEKLGGVDYVKKREE